MKKFLTYWCLALGAVLVLPSAFTAFTLLVVMSDAFDGASTFALAVAAFFTTMLAVGMFVFTPALVVLVIGLVYCAM